MNKQITLQPRLSSISRLLDSQFSTFVDEFFNNALPVRLLEQKDSYPKYNIFRQYTADSDDGELMIDPECFTVELAVAGFGQNSLKVTTKENQLRVFSTVDGWVDRKYLYKGIAERNFDWSMKLPEFSEIENVSLKNGILAIDIRVKVPEEKKEKSYKIGS